MLMKLTPTRSSLVSFKIEDLTLFYFYFAELSVISDEVNVYSWLTIFIVWDRQ